MEWEFFKKMSHPSERPLTSLFIPLYVGCPSKKYTEALAQKLSISWELNTCQMKDTFIRNRKVLHIESWISEGLASTELERDVTLKTPVQFFKNLKKTFLLELLQFKKETHYRLLPSRKQNIDILCFPKLEKCSFWPFGSSQS